MKRSSEALKPCGFVTLYREWCERLERHVIVIGETQDGLMRLYARATATSSGCYLLQAQSDSNYAAKIVG